MNMNFKRTPVFPHSGLAHSPMFEDIVLTTDGGEARVDRGRRESVGV